LFAAACGCGLVGGDDKKHRFILIAVAVSFLFHAPTGSAAASGSTITTKPKTRLNPATNYCCLILLVPTGAAQHSIDQMFSSV
jgi:hypothetical protein